MQSIIFNILDCQSNLRLTLQTLWVLLIELILTGVGTLPFGLLHQGNLPFPILLQTRRLWGIFRETDSGTMRLHST